MARLELNNSGVVFYPDTHQYFLNGIELSGITGAIQSQIAPDELTYIPEHILEKATQRGKASHESIEKFLKDWTNDGSQVVQDYIRICEENNLCSEASEYLVTDYKDYASAIDCVFRVDDNTFDLADIKTYSKLDATKREKVFYQLSIYAYFFEMVNPKAKVRNLYVIHLRDTEKEHIAELITIPRIPKEICQKLLQCELEGSQFDNPYEFHRTSNLRNPLFETLSLRRLLSKNSSTRLSRASSLVWRNQMLKPGPPILCVLLAKHHPLAPALTSSHLRLDTLRLMITTTT